MSGKRRQPSSSSSVSPWVDDHIDGRPVLGRERHHARVGAQQLAALAECDRVHGICGGCARERGGEALQARGTAAGQLGAPARLGLRCADEADDQLRECKDRQAHAAPRVLDAETRDRAARSSTAAPRTRRLPPRSPRIEPPTSAVPSTMIRKTIAGVVVATTPSECGDKSAVATQHGDVPPPRPLVHADGRSCASGCAPRSQPYPVPPVDPNLRGVSQNALRSALLSCRGPRCPRSRRARAAARAS